MLRPSTKTQGLDVLKRKAPLCTDTSSAEVGLSQTINRGCTASARAMAMR